MVRTQPVISGINDYRADYIFDFFTTECLWLNEREPGLRLSLDIVL